METWGWFAQIYLSESLRGFLCLCVLSCANCRCMSHLTASSQPRFWLYDTRQVQLVAQHDGGNTVEPGKVLWTVGKQKGSFRVRKQGIIDAFTCICKLIHQSSIPLLFLLCPVQGCWCLSQVGCPSLTDSKYLQHKDFSHIFPFKLCLVFSCRSVSLTLTSFCPVCFPLPPLVSSPLPRDVTVC